MGTNDVSIINARQIRARYDEYLCEGKVSVNNEKERVKNNFYIRHFEL